jgi:peroxiredoxin
MPGRMLLRVAMLFAACCTNAMQACAADAPAACVERHGRAKLDFTLRDPAGRPVELGQFRGRVLLVNFWATWCKPCRTEIPWLVEMFHAHRDAGFAVLGVSVDEDVARIRPFARAMGIDYPLAVGRGEDAFLEAFGPLLGYPTSVLVARDGRICVRHTGITTREALEREVRALLSP